MFMGACPELHGYTEWGSRTPEIPSRVVNRHGIFPTIFSLLREADHGGIGKGHGGKTLQELETPFIIAGKNVKRIPEFKESMMQFDIAATIAYIFDLKTPQVWIGRPMKQVFK